MQCTTKVKIFGPYFRVLIWGYYNFIGIGGDRGGARQPEGQGRPAAAGVPWAVAGTRGGPSGP